MLYDLNFLNIGEIFPPPSEWERLKSYEENRALFQQDLIETQKQYDLRAQKIISKFADQEGWEYESSNSYHLTLNYWQLAALKSSDMICGTPPTISRAKIDRDRDENISTEEIKRQLSDQKKAERNISDILDNTDFYEKLSQAVIDISMLGDSIVAIYQDGNKNNFSVKQPDIWFPIVDSRYVEKRLNQVLCWISEIKNDNKKEYKLNAEIHYIGYYETRVYSVEKTSGGNHFIRSSDSLNINIQTFEIKSLDSVSKKINTGLNDFAIVEFHNTVLSGNVYGINDFDRITSIVLELSIRYMMSSLILDKHSAPTLVTGNGAGQLDAYGEWKVNLGGVLKISANDPNPYFLTWDGHLSDNLAMIEKLENQLYSLSEMGAVLNDSSFGASQGFEALETRMTNARLKARRQSNRLTKPVKHLISLLSQRGYKYVEENSISVYWNDGLPSTEYRETDIALKKNGNKQLFDNATVLHDHFDKTIEEAEIISEKIREENKDSGIMQYIPDPRNINSDISENDGEDENEEKENAE